MSESSGAQEGRPPASSAALAAAFGVVCFASAALLLAAQSAAAAAGLPDGPLTWLFALSIAANLGLAAFALNRRRRLLDLRADERSFRDLYENISEGVFRSTLDGRMISANPSLVRLNGYETEEQLIRCCNDIAREWYVDPNRRADLHEMLLKSGRVSVVSEIYRHHTRERIWIEESVRLVRDKTGAPLHYDGTVREVTETIRRLELQDHYDKIASIVSGCLYQYRLTPDGLAHLPYASVGLKHIFGVRPEEVAADASVLRDMVHPDDQERLTRSIEQSRDTLTAWQCEYRIITREGQEKWVFGHSAPEREADGSTLWHGYLTDVSERKRTEAKIYDLAYFDPLTHLPNRTMLRDRLRQALAPGEEKLASGAVLFIDLDHFKVLNDSKGHHAGDLLLCEVARRIRSCVRQDDLVARLGGDEFVVLLEKLSSDADRATVRIQAVGEQILAAIDNPFMLGEHAFQTTASIGVALLQGGDEVDEVLKRADLAMYEAKGAGRGTLRFFRREMQVVVEHRLALTSDLRYAHLEGQLALHYQAQVDRSGRWFAAEALLRWSHPTRGPISPAEFIPLAERGGLMDSIDQWVLETACATLKSWEKDALTRDLQLAVNVGAQQLNRKGYVAGVRDVLRRSGADPARLKLELTEHAMLDDPEEVSAAMLDLKTLGVSFALDDFGTGYSSLSYLKRLPIDTLKIDRSFVRDIESDPSDREIVQTILNIARSLRVSVIAEGVESEMQALLLRQLGCNAFQGYLFAKPMPMQDFLLHLSAGREAEAAPASETAPVRAAS